MKLYTLEILLRQSLGSCLTYAAARNICWLLTYNVGLFQNMMDKAIVSICDRVMNNRIMPKGDFDRLLINKKHFRLIFLLS